MDSTERLRRARGAMTSRILVSAAVLLATACSTTDGDPESSKTDDLSKTDGLVCGLVSQDLVRRVLGKDPIETGGKEFADDGSFARCRVVNDKTDTTVMQLAIGRADPAEWGPKMDQERASSSYGDCVKTYDGDPGAGYGCTYEKGVWRFGAGVRVLSGGHLIRATVYNWADATPEDRLALAEEVARDLARNFS